MGLTPKQEKFCQNIVKGMSQADAYRDVYNTENMKEETIWSESCRMMNNPKVTARVKELTEVTVKDIKYEIEDCFRETDEILQLAKMTDNLQIMLKAVEQKGKLKGLFKDKVDLSGSLAIKTALVEYIDGDSEDKNS